MSAAAMKWWRRARHRAPHPTAMLVLHEACFEHVDGYAWQTSRSRKWAREMNMSDRAIRKALSGLEEAGLIQREGHRIRLCMEIDTETGTVVPFRGGTEVPGGGTQVPKNGTQDPSYKERNMQRAPAGARDLEAAPAGSTDDDPAERLRQFLVTLSLSERKAYLAGTYAEQRAFERERGFGR